MKQGKTLTQLAQELERINETKRDFNVPVKALKAEVMPFDFETNERGQAVETKPDRVALSFEGANGKETFSVKSFAGSQIAGYTDIPKQYFDRLAEENPGLLATNINHGLTRHPSDKRLVRTIDGQVRGFLSNRFRMLDSYDLMETVLPTLLDKGFEVMSSEVTEKRLYLKAATAKVEGEIVKGDVVRYGVMVSNSDVGAGSLRIEPFITRLVCMNGMVMESKFKRAHLGGARLEDHVQELLTDSTRQLNDKAFFATVRDYLLATMRPEIFQAEINKMREAAKAPIRNVADLDRVVELSMSAVGVKGEGTKKGILAALATGNEGAGLTKWGLVNSFTRYAQDDAIDYETATELERAGGLILDLSESQWKKISA